MGPVRSITLFAAAAAISAGAVGGHGAVAAGRHGASAQAQAAGALTYNILAWGYYCADGTTTCSPFGDQYRYADAEAYGAPYTLSGTPASVYAECDQPYTESTGRRVDAYELVNSFFDGGDPVRIIGNAALGPNATELNTASTGRLAYFAQDFATGDTATVSGSQTAENTSDRPGNRGGFTITLRGPIYDFITNRQIGSGTITCSTAHLLPVPGQTAAENEYEPFDPAATEPD